MEPPPNSHWSSAPGNQPPGAEHQRPSGSFGATHPMQQMPPISSVALPPPNQGNMYRPPNSNSLPPLTGLPQSSPQQPPHPLSQQRQTPPVSHHQPLPPQQSNGYTLPALGQPVPQERQYHDAELREMEERRQQEQEMIDQQRGEQRSPPSAHAGAIPLQQPTASRIPQALHAPNGLLSANPTAGLASALGAPTGPLNVFATNAPSNELNRGYLQPSGNAPQHLPVMNQSQHPQQGANGAGMSQGPQPILNDALTYLDQVKVRFADQPEVYNKFLDIMKEFKSQAIDTPGVIDRVSTLFNGHPQLIQGFNTFLPPGYKIEAGWGDDPNSIRVTTPSGSKIQNTGMPNSSLGLNSRSGRSILGDPNQSPSHTYVDPAYRPMDGNYDARRAMALQREGRQGWSREDEVNQTDAMLMHQQEQRGVTQLQDAAHIAEAQGGAFAGGQPMEAQSSIQEEGPGASGNTLHALPGEKRPAVEFNHAINYVNKIKTRFAQQPETYKQFLEILQTYQRESKPIQEVYAQVTELFKGASDLLEDFKQFLPESAAHARQQAARILDIKPISNERGDANYIRSIPNLASTPKADKMPPIGHFGPASVTKENKKRRAGPTSAAPPPMMAESSKTENAAQASNPAKRQKINLPKTPNIELSIPSPSLVPELPRPMLPTVKAIDANSVLERIRKFLGNKAVWLEFLRTLEGYNSGLISKDEMVAKIDDSFIGQNIELSSTFKKVVDYDGRDNLMDNFPTPSDNKVVLSNCRSYGPSYRLLPKRELGSKCSGRDAMCYDVLNDEWASHPTWASEDAGFMAHKKNQFEEVLHRMEEERHDYDFNIESANRVVLLLEPLVQQLKSLSQEEQRAYVLPHALGGQSEAIWQRVLKKLYERVAGQKMIDEMRARPSKTAPVVLLRLKEKLEKWKQNQREWEKIWREQTTKVFWKSLDHQAINAKVENKKYFQPKQLQTDINVKYEEQKRQRQLMSSNLIPRYQFEYVFTDTEVVLDACHMMLTFLRTSWAGNDASKIESFIKTFVPVFFGLDKELFTLKMADVYNETPPNEEDDDSTANEEAQSQRTKRPNGRQNLLRGVLDPSKSNKKDSQMTSKESTPDVMSVDEEPPTPTDSQSDTSKAAPLDSRWVDIGRGRSSAKLNEPFTRTSYSLYANLNIYCFMRLFSMFYERLLKIKLYEDEVQEDVRRALIAKASDMVMNMKSPLEYFDDVSPTANYYKQIVKMCESYLENQTEIVKIEETLRRFYIPCGYQLYNFDKWLSALLKFAGQAAINDTKDRSNDIISLFLTNRVEPQTTHQAEIDYRKQVEKHVKDGDVYRIIYHSEAQRVTMQVFKRDDQTFDTEGKTGDFNWSYYATSYAMRDWTEGVPRIITWPFLKKNLPKDAEIDGEALEDEFLPETGGEKLSCDILANSYRLTYTVGSSEWWVHSKAMRAKGLKGLAAAHEERNKQFEAKLVKGERWAAGLSTDEIEQATAIFGQRQDTVPKQPPASNGATAQDVQMDDA